MVSLIPNYEKQRYVFNSNDDPGDIEFHNGDVVYLMDVRQEIIFSEEDNQWYPVPTGGGVVLYKSYIQAETWNTGSVGNAPAFISAYLDDATADGIYVAIVSNNEDNSLYAAKGAIIYNNLFVSGRTVQIVSRPKSDTTDILTSTWLYITAGATIDVYYIAKELFFT